MSLVKSAPGTSQRGRRHMERSSTRIAESSRPSGADNALRGRTPHREHGYPNAIDQGMRRISVVLWGPDGKPFEGTISRNAEKVLFVETTQLVPVHAEVTLQRKEPDNQASDYGVATGTVLWQCPTADQFTNRKGFGLSLQSHWAQQTDIPASSTPKEVQ